MQEKIVIYLHPTLSSVGWALINAQGQVTQSKYSDNLQALAPLSENKEIIVIVPTEDTLFLSVTLPKMSRSKLLQALPFALEDHVMGEVDQLHFALGDAELQGLWPVVVVNKDKMQEWLSLLHSHHIQPQAFYASMQTIPHIENHWDILIDEIAIVRTGKAQGFACDKANLPALLQSALKSVSQLPFGIHLYNFSGKAIAHDLAMDIGIEENLLNKENLLPMCCEVLQKTQPINLLQGSFAVKQLVVKTKWDTNKVIKYLLAALILLFFLIPLFSYFILAGQMDKLDQQITQVFHKHFPNNKIVRAPKPQLEKKLQQLRTQTGQQQALLLMGYVGQVLNKTPGVKIKRLDYKNNQLTLDVSANTSDNFLAFTNRLTEQGLNVRQQNANLAGEHINAILVIEAF